MTADEATAADLERIGRLFLLHGQPVAAGQLLAAAATLDPKSESILRMRTLAAYRAGAYREAMSLSRQAVAGAAGRGRSALTILESVSLMRLGRQDEARARFLSADTGSAAGPDTLDGARALKIEPEAP